MGNFFKYLFDCMRTMNSGNGTFPPENGENKTIKLKYNCNNKIVNFNGDYIVKKKSDEITDYMHAIEKCDEDTKQKENNEEFDSEKDIVE